MGAADTFYTIVQHETGPTAVQVDYRVTRSVGYMALLPISCLLYTSDAADE